MLRPLFLIFTLISILHGQEEDLLPLPDILPLGPEEDVLPPTIIEPLPPLEPFPENFSTPKQEHPQILTPPKNVDIDNKGVTFSYDNGAYKIRYKGPIRLKGDNGLEVFADSAVLDSRKEIVILKGNVSAYQNGLVYRGSQATYLYNQKKLVTTGLRSSMDPILLESGKFRAEQRNGKTIFIGDQAGITTHDVEKPNFWLKAERTTIFPDDKVVFKDLKFKFGDRTIFWLPYLSQPLDQRLGYHFTPGGRSNLGVFLESRYGVMLGGERHPETGENDTAWLLSQWHADLYTRRGLGLGLDLIDTRTPSEYDFGWLKLYYIYDLDPTVSRSGIARENISPNRGRAELAQRFHLGKTDTENYDLEANLTYLSDRFFLEDYDNQAFRNNPEPDNTLALKRRTASSLATLGGRFRINDFYQSDTRLPEFTFDWVRQPILNSQFLYESQTSLGLYDEHLSAFDIDDFNTERAGLLAGDPRIAEIDKLLEDRGFIRAHTYHEISRPSKLGHLNIVPRAGFGHTAYRSVEGPADSFDRTHVFAGVDTSLKLTKSYPHVVNKKWGLDGMLHTIQPYANFSLLSTNELDSSFQSIDRLTPSTRPRSLNVGRFTAIDDLQNWSILRFGVRNRLMTNRDGGKHDWFTLDTYFDAFLDDPEFSRTVSNLYNDLTWKPLPWLALELETQFPLFSESNFTEIATNFRFMPSNDLEFQIGYRYLSNHPILIDSNRITLETFYRINEHWGVGSYQRFEIEDSTLELQQYSLHYDFDSWVGSIGAFHRDNRIKDEYGLVFSFGLKDFPSLSLPIKIDAE